MGEEGLKREENVRLVFVNTMECHICGTRVRYQIRIISVLAIASLQISHWCARAKSNHEQVAIASSRNALLSVNESVNLTGYGWLKSDRHTKNTP